MAHDPYIRKYIVKSEYLHMVDFQQDWEGGSNFKRERFTNLGLFSSCSWSAGRISSALSNNCAVLALWSSFTSMYSTCKAGDKKYNDSSQTAKSIFLLT